MTTTVTKLIRFWCICSRRLQKFNSPLCHVSVHCNVLRATEWIFMKFNTGKFHETLPTYYNFDHKWTKIMDTLHENLQASWA
jgi:hypothetical protein